MFTAKEMFADRGEAVVYVFSFAWILFCLVCPFFLVWFFLH